jgi:UDP-N-acetylmuramate dehydrogenase
MALLQQHVSLRSLNTFGFDVQADNLIVLSDVAQLAGMGAFPHPLRVLGGGSNVLMTGHVHGTVILNQLKGIQAVEEDESHVWVRSGAGEVWHDLVLYAIGNGLGGIENLALIPGTVGASPIQNIGAYGVEVKDTITSVEAWHWKEGAVHTFTNEDCRFGYRDSIFKHELKDKVVVTAVTFRLSKHPKLHTEYGAIAEELAQMGAIPSVKSIAQAVINIRRSKLPDPAVIGNAGSFFKNPTIQQSAFDDLHEAFPALPAYAAGPGFVKVPAGWMIEHCGWKGYRDGDAGVHAKQALVLVNYGSAHGTQILQLSAAVMDSVQEKFGIMLEREVQVW